MPPGSAQSQSQAHTQSQWRSCAFNRGPMTMPVLDGPMTMPVLDGVKPMAITLPICGTSESLFWKRKKSIYCWTRSRPTWTFGESDDQVRDKSESKYQRVQDKSETIEKRLESGLESETGLEYYSPSLNTFSLDKQVTALHWCTVILRAKPHVTHTCCDLSQESIRNIL